MWARLFGLAALSGPTTLAMDVAKSTSVSLDNTFRDRTSRIEVCGTFSGLNGAEGGPTYTQQIVFHYADTELFTCEQAGAGVCSNVAELAMQTIASSADATGKMCNTVDLTVSEGSASFSAEMYASTTWFVTAIALEDGEALNEMALQAQLSNAFAVSFYLYDVPVINTVEPQSGSVAGGLEVTIAGNGLRPASKLQIKVALNDEDYGDVIERVADGEFDAATGTVIFTTEPFGVPLGVAQEVEENDDAGELRCIVSVSFNGQDFVPWSGDFTYIVEKQKTVGYVFFGDINDFGWTYAQNIGRLQTDTTFAGLVKSDYIPEVEEGGECVYADGSSAWNWGTLQCDSTAGNPHWEAGYNAIKHYCEKEYTLVFACSFGYLWQMADLSGRDVCSKTKLVHVSGFFQTPQMSTVFARIFESRYLAGIIAGRALKKGTSRYQGDQRPNNCVGYLAAFPIPEVKRGINAFTVGCREVWEHCDVRVMYIATWSDEFTEEKAAEWFWEHEGCDIITQHSDTESPQLVFKDEGGFGLGYHADQRLVVGDSVLTSATIEWGPVFSYFVNSILNNDYTPGIDYWPGFESGAVSITDLSPEIDQETANLVNIRRQQLIDQEWQIFCKSSVEGSDEDQLQMHDGSFLPDIQPDIPGVTFGAGLPNFQSFTFDGQVRECLTNFPGLLDMWWDVDGVSYPNKLDGTPFEEDEVEISAGGELYFDGKMLWYTPPPKDPPLTPSVVNEVQDYHTVKLEFASEMSEGGNPIKGYIIQADVTEAFTNVKELGVTDGMFTGCEYKEEVFHHEDQDCQTHGRKKNECWSSSMCNVFFLGENTPFNDGTAFEGPLAVRTSSDTFLGSDESVTVFYDTLPDCGNTVCGGEKNYSSVDPWYGELDQFFIRVAAFDGVKITGLSEWGVSRVASKVTRPKESTVAVVEVKQDQLLIETQGEESLNGETVLGIEVQVSPDSKFSPDSAIYAVILDISDPRFNPTASSNSTAAPAESAFLDYYSGPDDSSSRAWCEVRRFPLGPEGTCPLMLPYVVPFIEKGKCEVIDGLESLSGCWKFVLDGLSAQFKGRAIYVRSRSYDTRLYSEWSDVTGASYVRVLDPIGGVETAVAAFAIITIVVAVAFSLILATKRTHRVIKRSSPLFCIMMCVGVMIVAASTFIGDQDPNEGNCQCHFTLLLVGFSLVIGPQFAKTWRIMKIMTDKSFRKRVITDAHVGAIMISILLIDLVLLVLWFVLEPVGEVRTDADYDDALYTSYCWVVPDEDADVNDETSTTIFSYLVTPYKVALLLFGVIVLFQMRNVKFPKELAEFNEIKHMSFNLYNWFFTMIIVAPLLSSETKPSTRFVLKNFALLWCCLVTLGIFFVPKFMMIESGLHDKSTHRKSSEGTMAGSSAVSSEGENSSTSSESTK